MSERKGYRNKIEFSLTHAWKNAHLAANPITQNLRALKLPALFIYLFKALRNSRLKNEVFCPMISNMVYFPEITERFIISFYILQNDISECKYPNAFEKILYMIDFHLLLIQLCISK